MDERTDSPPSGKPPTGFPEPPGVDPGDHSRDPEPHHALTNPADAPGPSEWPVPYEPWEGPKRDKLDD
jgi:hypothetical protein